MVTENGNNPEKRDGSQGFQLKPSDYQPAKEELEADVSLPASFDEVVDALFASDREFPKPIQAQNSPGQ